MDGFFSVLTAGVIGEVGGWLVLVLGVVFMGRMFQTGKLQTESQVLRELNRMEAHFKERLEEGEKHFLELMAATRSSFQATIDTMKAAHDERLAERDARLDERDELLDEYRANLARMLEIYQANADGLSAAVRTATTTERVLAAFEEAFGVQARGGSSSG